MEDVNFSIGIDSSKLKTAIKDSVQGFSNLGNSATASGIAIEKAIGSSFSEHIAQTKNGINLLEDSMKELQKTIDATAPGKEWANLVNQKKEVANELQREKAILADLTVEQQKHENSSVSLRTKIAGLRQQLATLTEGTEEYHTVMVELGKEQDRYSDIQSQGRIFADDYKYFNATREAVQGLAGAMSAGVGIASLFGVKNEDLTKVQAKLQSVMAISIGVQQLATIANKDSYFSHIILAKAKAVDASVTAFVSKALVGLRLSTIAANIAAKGLMITLTGGLILGVWALVAAYNAWDKKQEENKRKTEELKKEQQSFNDSIAESASKTIIQLRLLQSAYAQIGDSMVAKQKFIKDNKKAFDDLGVSIQTVADLENLLINNTKSYIASVMAKAKADAYAELAKEKIKESIALGSTATYEVATKKISKTATSNTGVTVSYKEEVRDVEKTNANKEKALKEHTEKKKKLEEEASAYISKGAVEMEKTIAELKKAGLAAADKDLKLKKEKISEEQKAKEKSFKDILAYEQEAQKELLKNSQNLELDKSKGTKKELEKRYLYVLADIQKQEDAYKKAAVAAGVKKTEQEVELPKVYKELQNQAKLQYGYELEVFDLGKSKERLRDFEDMANEYIEKYAALEKLKKTASDPTKIKAAGFSTEEIGSMIDQQSNELQFLSQSLLLNDQELQAFISEVVVGGIEATSNKLQELQALLAVEQVQGKSQNDTAALEAKIQALKLQLSLALKDVKKEETKDSSLERWKSTHTVLTQVNKTIDESISSFDSLSDEVKGVIKSVTGFSSMTLQMVNGITELANWSSKSIAMTAQGASQAVIMVEKASLILTVISTAIQIVTKIIDLVKSDKAKQAAKQTAEVEDRIKSLEKAYDKLQKAIEKTYGQNASNLIEQGNQLLEQQKQQLQLLISQEKVKAKNANKEKDREEAAKSAKQYQDQLDEINSKIEENKEKAIDAFFGSGIKSSIDKLADYYVDSFGKSNSEIAKGQKAFVKKMIQDMITQIVKAALSEDMDKLRQAMISAMLDGVITQEEEDLIDAIVNGMYAKADEKTKGLGRWLDNSEDTRSAEAKGIARASQDSVDENNALLTTMVGNTREFVVSQGEILSFVSNIAGYVSDIFYTVKSIKEDTKAIKRGIEDIRDKGITLKK